MIFVIHMYPTDEWDARDVVYAQSVGCGRQTCELIHALHS